MTSYTVPHNPTISLDVAARKVDHTSPHSAVCMCIFRHISCREDQEKSFLITLQNCMATHFPPRKLGESPAARASNNFQQYIGQFSRHRDHGIMARWQLPQTPYRLTWMTTGYRYVSYMLREGLEHPCPMIILPVLPVKSLHTRLNVLSLLSSLSKHKGIIFLLFEDVG